MVAISISLTILAGLWRWADGRGWGGRTTYRNLAGLAIALGCAAAGMDGYGWGQMGTAAGCAIIAWASLIVGHTRWESWVSVARYGGPTCAIAALAYVGGAPVLACALYASGGVLVGLLYVTLHRYVPFRYSTAVCEAAAGAVIVGGLAWLRA